RVRLGSMFNSAHDFSIDQLNVTVPPPSPGLSNALAELESHVATGAMHDSAERCDAPKCHAETRVALQSDLFSWITEGDIDSEPQKIRWVTGPAGTGKTAVMGSLAYTCEKKGMLAASFFFASWSNSILRRLKTAFIPTLAHQLAQHSPAFRSALESVIDKNPIVFKKTLDTQMKMLILEPLRSIKAQSDRSQWPRAIVIDGVHECEAEQYHTPKAPVRERTKEDDQEEILHALHEAAMDPAFPFRIVVASRPERVFREFFDPQRFETSGIDAPDEVARLLGSFAPSIDLHEHYNANDDITLYLRAKFNEIRRRHNLRLPWPLPSVMRLLVDQASDQFIYATTVLRFLTDSRLGDPQTLLEVVLAVRVTNLVQGSGNPFLHLDALYIHILESSPNPPLAAQWIWIVYNCIQRPLELAGPYSISSHAFNQERQRPAAIHINQWLRLLDGGAEHLFGTLHSLLKVPSPKDIDEPYSLYHKSLLDFLRDPQRCGHLYVEEDERRAFFWDRYLRVCDSKPTVFSSINVALMLFICDSGHGITGDATEQAKFLGFFFRIEPPSVLPSLDRIHVTSSGVDWWMKQLITISWPGEEHILPALERFDQIQFIRDMFVLVHMSLASL
ncbi:hypothetical protein EST38_g6043, partial [Candolleomyces aberdarensis]